MKYEEQKRARRRHDLARMKAKAVRIYGRFDRMTDGSECPWDPQRHAKLANHLAHCSNACCGNPRRNGWDNERTMQERRAFQCEEWRS